MSIPVDSVHEMLYNYGILGKIGFHHDSLRKQDSRRATVCPKSSDRGGVTVRIKEFPNNVRMTERNLVEVQC